MLHETSRASRRLTSPVLRVMYCRRVTQTPSMVQSTPSACAAVPRLDNYNRNAYCMQVIYIAALLWFTSDKQHALPPHPRSLDRNLLVTAQVYMPNLRAGLPAPCVPPSFTAITASNLASRTLPFYHYSVSSTALQSRCNES
jgi:hypothetical protein